MTAPPLSNNAPRPKLWLTGASGFLGWYVAEAAQAQWQVIGTYHRHAVTVPGIALQQLDLTDAIALRQFFSDLRPDAVIHTAALSQPNRCQENPELSQAINVTASTQLAELCAEVEIPFVFTSSDQVFDGTNAPYRETDPVSPLNLYGEHKATAEAEILRHYPLAAICRMALMYGAAPTATNFLQTFLTQMTQGKTLRLFTDEFRTPLSGRDAAVGLLLALEKAQGLLQLAGGDRLSRYEMGNIMVEVFDLPASRIQPSRQADVPMPAPRPPDVSADISLARSLGFAPHDFRSELERLKRANVFSVLQTIQDKRS
ncbi:MAG: NAD(P)-dependent oxidoreductase [Cyanobacteria bacterium J06638_20]